jgi:hypothetical protein
MLDKYVGADFHPLYSTSVRIGGGATAQRVCPYAKMARHVVCIAALVN